MNVFYLTIQYHSLNKKAIGQTMRSRNIKPGIFKNELLGVEDPILTIIFMGLWCAADRNGVIEDRPLRLRAEILPYRMDIDFNGYLTVLSRLEFIHRYKVNNNPYIQVINFKKHQRPHHTEKHSGFPEYELKTDSCDLTVSSPLEDGKNPPDSLIPDSLIPDSSEKPKKQDTLEKHLKDKIQSNELSEHMDKLTEFFHYRKTIKKSLKSKQGITGFVNVAKKLKDMNLDVGKCFDYTMGKEWQLPPMEYFEKNCADFKKEKVTIDLCMDSKLYSDSDYQAGGLWKTSEVQYINFKPAFIPAEDREMVERNTAEFIKNFCHGDS